MRDVNEKLSRKELAGILIYYFDCLKYLFSYFSKNSVSYNDLPLQDLLPEHWKEIINQTINDNFGKEIYEAQQEQKAIENARIRAQQQALIRSRTPRKKSSPIGKFFKGVKRHFSKKFG